MRRPLVISFLSLVILALFIAAGFWMLRRSERGPAPLAPPSSARTGSEGGDSSNAGAAAAKSDAGPEPDAAEAPLSKASDDELISGAPVSIEGRVTDGSGNGVAGARVAAIERRALTEAIERDAKRLDRDALEALRAFRGSLSEVAKRLPSCLTAADGSYALRGLPDGDHRVVVTHSRFLNHAEDGWILVESGRKVRYDVELVAGETISGRVLDARGDPVPGALVRATPVESGRLKGLGKVVQVFIDEVEGASILEASPVETDRRGMFRLSSLEPGVYDLRAVRQGYAWGEARDVPSGIEEVSIALPGAIRVSGRVVTPAGDPVVGAAIALREPERDIQGPQGPLAVAYVDLDLFREKDRGAASGEEGRFSLEPFVPGTYDLVVRAEGFPELRKSVTVDNSPLDLGDLPLAESREIAGTVVSPDGAPVEGAAVWVPKPSRRREDPESRRNSVLEAGPSSSVALSQSDRRGAFRLSGLGGAALEVAILADGFPGEYRESVPTGGRGVTIVLRRGLTVRGRVIEAEGGGSVPLARVVVEGGPARETITDERGAFELRGLTLGGGGTLGGSVAVRASREGYREARATAAFPDPAAVPVAEVEMALGRLGKDAVERPVSGVVRDGRGEPIAGALVWAEVLGVPRAVLRMVAGDRARDVRTGADGTFILSAPRFGGQRFEILASSPGLATARRGPFSPEGEEGVWPFVEIELAEGVSLEGRVSGADGAPVAGARVRIERDVERSEEETVFTRLLPPPAGEGAFSGKDGTYRLRRIEPGAYRVEARAQGFAAKTIGPVEIRSAVGVPGVAPAPARIDIVLDAGGSLAGRVVDPDGESLSGIEVVAFPVTIASAPPAGEEEEDELVRTGALGALAAVTGADGIYRIEHLPEGEYRLQARGRGFEPDSIPSAVPGEPLPDLVLERHARIIGIVRDGTTGALIRSFEVTLDPDPAEGKPPGNRRRSLEFDDPRGRFAVEGLRAGEWRVMVSAAQHVAWVITLPLESGGELELVAALSSGCRILGVVRRPDGAPIAEASINVQLEGKPGGGASARSGEDGSFVIAGLDGGSYLVQAAHPDHFAESAEATAKVELSAAQEASVALVLRPAGRILGRIRGLVFKAPGSDQWIVTFSPIAPLPAAGGLQRLGGAASGEGAPQPFWVWADESGTFTRESVRPGKYRVELVHKRSSPETGGEWVTVPPESRPLGEIEVRAGEMANFQKELSNSEEKN